MSSEDMETLNLVHAVNRALFHAMDEDPNVLLLGEDIGLNGGVFRATAGLFEHFGAERVLDTPLGETMLAGVSIGMAAQGLKPVVEFQFMGFIYSAVDQIINHAARMRHRTRGRLQCPVVYRAPYGGGIAAPEHHSESTEAIFAHMPGLRVVIPSSPARAYGLLLAAIRNPDPVIFLEPKRMYRLLEQSFVCDGKSLPLDQCFVDRIGTDVTIVSWGAMMHETLQAADALQERGLSAEVIDVATVKCIDIETLLASVEKTGRLVIVHEAARYCGVGAEIAAQVAEYGWDFLEAPVQRVTGYDTVMPYFKRERDYLPDVERILQAVDWVMEY